MRRLHFFKLILNLLLAYENLRAFLIVSVLISLLIIFVLSAMGVSIWEDFDHRYQALNLSIFIFGMFLAGKAAPYTGGPKIELNTSELSEDEIRHLDGLQVKCKHFLIGTFLFGIVSIIPTHISIYIDSLMLAPWVSWTAYGGSLILIAVAIYKGYKRN